MPVPARLHIVTLGVADLGRSVAFYEGLGWERVASSGPEISWFRVTGSYVGLFGLDSLAEDAALPAAPRAPFGGITLAMCVESEEAAEAALEAAVAAGARLLKPAQRTPWGGYSGYFADPDGHPWEVAFNPHFALSPEGALTIP